MIQHHLLDFPSVNGQETIDCPNLQLNMTLGSGAVTPLPHVVSANGYTTVSMQAYQELMALYNDLLSLFMTSQEQSARLQTVIHDAIAVLETRQALSHDLYTPETLLLDELREAVGKKA